MNQYTGTLGRVFKNEIQSGKRAGEPYWSVEIDTDAKGPVKFLCFSTSVAESLGPLGEGDRVVFDAKPGKEKDDGTAYPPTLEVIALEGGIGPTEPERGQDVPKRGPIVPESGMDLAAIREHVKAARLHLEALAEAVK